MCLGVYLGTSRPLARSSAGRGGLVIAESRWTPPPLKRSSHAYVVGAGDGRGNVSCSCALSEYVVWGDDGPVVHSDDTAPGDPCPFETLRSWCDEATHDGGLATIACDDGGGTEQACSDDDYSYGLVRLALIARGNLLFADSHGGFPWRVLYVVR